MTEVTADAIRRGTENGGKDNLNEQLRDALLALSYPAFEECMRLLLGRMGYENVCGERDHFRGRNRDGGYDMAAISSTGVTKAKVIAQLKQYAGPVPKRYVDELRGTMLRTRARHGLLVTTSAFSPVARRAAENCPIAPIRLVEGTELTALLIAHRIGISKSPTTDLTVDTHFFSELAGRFPKPGRAVQVQQVKANHNYHAEAGRNSERGERTSPTLHIRITLRKERQ